jgi:hypothetical protein
MRDYGIMNQLTEYIEQYGLSAALEILMVICDDKAKNQEGRDRKRYEKASMKLYQLSKAKLLKGL